MTVGDLLAVFFVQAAILLVPLALGLIGLISSASAGLTSTAAWFLVGIPLSYAVVDGRRARKARSRGRAARLPAGRLRVDHAVRS